MPPEIARTRDQWVAAAMTATIAFLALFAAPTGRASAAEPDRYLVRGDIATAAWQIDEPSGRTFIDVVATDGWQQHDQGADHLTKYDYVTVLWTHVGTDAGTGRPTETTWEIDTRVGDGLRFDPSMRQVRLDLRATAHGSHCVYEAGGSGTCTSLGDALVHIDLLWTRVAEVTRDTTRLKELVEGLRIHQQSRVVAAVPAVTGSITGDVELIPSGLVPDVAVMARVAVTSHVFESETQAARR